jgi:chemotaxis protein methyltransferase WspC
VALAEIEKLLSTRLGFDVHSIGREAVATVIRQSMEEAGCANYLSYARILTANPVAWNNLVDRVVISETWFFRDNAPFALAAQLAHTHMRRRSSKVFRILSCPCSTGEEPYSLVISMLGAGAAKDSFAVDAVDVSCAALESAQAGAFRVRSFRGEDLSFRPAHFDQDESGLWRLNQSVASMVRFRQGNLVALDFLADEAPYDLVFCRNLLIYLHPEARLLAINALRRLVADEGVLVLGHAEAAFAREHGFKQTGHASAFAFVKPTAHTKTEARPASRRSPRLTGQSQPFSFPIAPPLPAAATIAEHPRRHESDPAQLTHARQLGDTGQLHHALQVCGDYLKLVPASSEGHFLLGVIHDALGHPELAVACFRKVLYLDPAHREALLHLALKRDAAGDRTGAALLRARARRLPHTDGAE